MVDAAVGMGCELTIISLTLKSDLLSLLYLNTSC
jgi:hypothetical protein